MENNLAETQPEQSTAAPVTADQAPASTPEPESTTKAPEPVKPADQEPDWFKKRFDEITAQRHREKDEADRRYQETARERDQYRQQLEQQRPKEPEKTKTLEDFGFNESQYQSYVLDQVRQAAREESARADSERQSQVQAERAQRKFREREVAFEKENKDYREVAHYAPINEAMAGALRSMDNGPEVAYWLGKNRDIALTLSDLPSIPAAIELGRIAARLDTEKAAKTAALEAARAAKAVSGAPSPTPRIEGAGEPGIAKADSADSDNLSDAEWAKRRNKQVAKQRP